MTIEHKGRGGFVTFADNVIEMTGKQARIVACLARGMPHPVDRLFIAKRVWAGERVPESYETVISNYISPIIAPLAGIGLTLKTVRGVGLSLQKAES